MEIIEKERPDIFLPGSSNDVIITSENKDKIFRASLSLQFLVGIFITILFSSVLFYEYKKDDWRMDKNYEGEYLKISQEVLKFAEGVNYHPMLGRYLEVEQIPNQWPISYDDISLKTELISPKQSSLNEFIQQNKQSLTHIIVDNKSDLPKFLIEIYEKEFEFLDLVYEYEIKENGEKFKVFKINYAEFDEKL